MTAKEVTDKKKIYTKIRAVTELAELARSVSVFDNMHKPACRQDLRSSGKSDVLKKAHHCGCIHTEKSLEKGHCPFAYEKFYLKKNKPNKNVLLAISFSICI